MWFGTAKTVFLVAAFCVATAIASPAQTFESLVSFNFSNGSGPGIMSLVQGTDGSLYGTTTGGGTNGGQGTVFKITPGGTLTTLYGFPGGTGVAFPNSGLIQATDGNFYGTTEEGGSNGPDGTVFKITPAGTLTILHSFCAETNCSDGQQPDAGLVQASNGKLYGTTQGGGINGYGTIFEITLNGTLTTLYSFCAQTNCADGSFPNSALVQARDGNLYGTTINTFFKITPSGNLTTIYSFVGSDGIFAAPVQAVDGNFYGTSDSGGAHNAGTVYKITPTGVLTQLYSFCSLLLCADGNGPYGSLIQGTDGNFYGTTYGGGKNVDGTVFKITPTGALTTLYSFCPQSGCADGSNPYGGLVQATNGKFYGSTYYGGANQIGTVFSLAMGLRPFVETRPISGAAGAKVTILGSNLTGATAVSFNGSPAAFKVVSNSEIVASVPIGATSGRVEVTTSTSILKSNTFFSVLK